MKIGFTGTQDGMTAVQENAVRLLMKHFQNKHDNELHHGDCLGADAQAHEIGRKLGYWIVVHPPSVERKRAFCQGDEERPKRDYLIRNHKIVDETELLIATPKTEKEMRRSGTWATIRYASKARKRVVFIVLPNGRFYESRYVPDLH